MAACRLATSVVFCAAFAAARFMNLNEDYQAEVDIIGSGENTSILLLLTVNTKGYVGFGFGPNPNMTGADLFIGGVNNSMLYGKDYHGIGNTAPEEDCDTCQDWEVVTGVESDSGTSLVIQRLVNTLDTDGDIEIQNSTTYVLWSYGEFDIINHHRRRGFRELNLFTVDDPRPGSSTPNPN
ncbi:unnamed protein product [Orchesella dallaii]|uniref:DOMON domain-containing protein n=1 Tax=Orchesella dallaii TaxID=48710 RepID=A0ABP1RPQ5_9HEXA